MNLQINKDNYNRGLIISIDDNNYSDEEMAEFLHMEEFEYMNLLSLNGSVKHEEINSNISKVCSIFENRDETESSKNEILNYINK